MELGLYCPRRHIYYTFDLCLTQRICVGLFLSGVIALKPLRSAHIASLWQEHLVAHKPAEAPELWHGCSGRFMYSTSVPQPAAQAGSPVGRRHRRVRRAELALPHLERQIPWSALCRESWRLQREKPRDGMGYDGSRTLTGTPAPYSFRMSRASPCYAPRYQYGIGCPGSSSQISFFTKPWP